MRVVASPEEYDLVNTNPMEKVRKEGLQLEEKSALKKEVSHVDEPGSTTSETSFPSSVTPGILGQNQTPQTQPQARQAPEAVYQPPKETGVAGQSLETHPTSDSETVPVAEAAREHLSEIIEADKALGPTQTAVSDNPPQGVAPGEVSKKAEETQPGL
jgi:hypothetical protein